MIKVYYEQEIIDVLAAILTYGFTNKYSYKYIEECLISSSFINKLEDNEYDSVTNVETVVKEVYKIDIKDKVDISFKALFLAESYIHLFFKLNKSFEYLFLYWPIEEFINKYDIYHEMDFSNLENDVLERIRNTTLLKKLSKDRKIKLSEISKLTGIKQFTINKYSKDDIHLFNASFINIYALTKLFNVKPNIFIDSIGVYLDTSIYLFHQYNEEQRNHLGYYYANFFDNRILDLNLKYIKDKKQYIGKNGYKLLVIVDELSNITLDRINSLSNNKTYVVIIPSAFIGNESSFKYLKEVDAFEVFALTPDFIYIVKKDIKKEVTRSQDKSLKLLSSGH